MQFPNGTPSTANTVPVLLSSLKNEYILEWKAHIHYHFFQNGQNIGLCSIFSTFICDNLLRFQTCT